MIRSRKHGYTIIEMLVVMVVLSVLATAAMPLVELSVKRNKERALRQELWEIRHAIDAYRRAYESGRIGDVFNTSGYPPSLGVLVTGVPDLKNSGQPIYFLRRLPRDPFAPPTETPEKSWGLRSYASTPDEPKEGGDVFDVYSKSDQIGMNGIPYRQW